MKLLLATLPDDAAGQARWLEEQILGLDLAGVVTELRAVSGRRGEPSPSLEEALGEALPRVLAGGFGGLSAVHLGLLLKNPELLIQLQTRIFLDGGEHWTRSSAPAGEMQRAIDDGRRKLMAFTESQSPSRPSSTRPGGGGEGDPVPRSVAWYRSPFVVSLATAAAVLAGVFLIRPMERNAPPAVAQGWGWNKPEAINGALPAKEYLASLATSANAWFNKRPATPETLAQRLIEFRQGCSALILSEHRPLKPEDKAWLIERCQAWAKKIDQHLADVEAGKDLLQVRGEADETVNKLMKALNDRSATA